MNNKIYDTIIFGCSYISIGFASANKNTLIIEETELVDHSFFGALNVGKNWDYIPETNEGKHFKKALEGFDIINGKLASINELSPVVFDYIKRTKLNILFLTNTVSIDKKEAFYEIVIFNNSGLSTLKAKNIIDTTPLGFFKKTSNILSKNINLLSYNNSSEFDAMIVKAFGKDAEVIAGNRHNERFVKIPLKIEANMTDARKVINDGWKIHLAEKCKIAMIAFDFHYEYEKTVCTISHDFLKLTDSNFENAVQAFDFGANFSFVR